MLSERNESDEERAASIKQAFVDGGDLTNMAEEKRIAERVINQFGKALINKSAAGIRSSFSGKTFINYCFQVSTKKISRKKKKQLMSLMEVKFAEILLQQSEALAFHETEILNIQVISDQEMTVFTRQWDNTIETYTRTRWWLTNKDGGWKIYDLEDMDTIFRFSSIVVAGIESSNGGATWLKAFQRIVTGVEAAEDLLSIDYASLEADAHFVIMSSAPKDFKKVALVIYLQALTESGQLDKGLKEALQAEKDYPEAHILKQFLGNIYFQQEEYDKAIISFNDYTDLMGKDSETMMVLSDVYYEKKELAKSLEYCLAGIKMNPRHAGCIASYAVLLDKSDWPKLLPLIKETKKAKEAIEIILDYAIDQEKLELAKWLFGHFKQQFPDDEELTEYYEEILSEDKQQEEEE